MSFHVRQERDDVDDRSIRRIGIGSVVVFVLAIVAAALIVGRHEGAAAVPPPRGTVERTLVLATKRGIDEREAQRRDLATWGWVDRDAGVARIPIDRAIDLVVAADGGAP